MSTWGTSLIHFTFAAYQARTKLADWANRSKVAPDRCTEQELLRACQTPETQRPNATPGLPPGLGITPTTRRRALKGIRSHYDRTSSSSSTRWPNSRLPSSVFVRSIISQLEFKLIEPLSNCKAGIAGLAQAIRLKERFGDKIDLQIFERAGDIGGVWRDSHWPCKQELCMLSRCSGALTTIPYHLKALRWTTSSTSFSYIRI